MSTDKKLTAIYAAIDNGNFSEAMRLCQKPVVCDNPLVRALLSYAYAAMRRHDDAMALAKDVLESYGTDETIVSTIAHTYKMCRADGAAVLMYEAALAAHPPSASLQAYEAIAQELFYAHTRLHQHKKMQLLAQQLYKHTDNPMYVLWAVTCMLLQGDKLEAVMMKVAEKLMRKIFYDKPVTSSSSSTKLMRDKDHRPRYHDTKPSYDNMILFLEVFKRQGEYIAGLEVLDHLYHRASSHDHLISSQQDWERHGNNHITCSAIEYHEMRLMMISSMMAGDNAASSVISSLSSSDMMINACHDYVSSCPEQYDAYKQYMMIIMKRGGRDDDVTRFHHLISSHIHDNMMNRAPQLSYMYLMITYPHHRYDDEYHISSLLTSSLSSSSSSSSSMISSSASDMMMLHHIQSYIMRFGHKLTCSHDLHDILQQLHHHVSSSLSSTILHDLNTWCQTRYHQLAHDILSSSTTTPTTTTSSSSSSKPKAKGKNKSSSSSSSPQQQLSEFVSSKSSYDAHQRSSYDHLSMIVTLCRIIMMIHHHHRNKHHDDEVHDDDMMTSPDPMLMQQIIIKGRELCCHDPSSSSSPSDELLFLLKSSIVISNDHDPPPHHHRSSYHMRRLSFCVLGQALASINLQWRLHTIREAIALGAGVVAWRHYMLLGAKHIQLETIAPLLCPALVQLCMYEEARTLYASIAAFHRNAPREVLDSLPRCFKSAAYSQALSIARFHATHLASSLLSYIIYEEMVILDMMMMHHDVDDAAAAYMRMYEEHPQLHDIIIHDHDDYHKDDDDAYTCNVDKAILCDDDDYDHDDVVMKKKSSLLSRMRFHHHMMTCMKHLLSSSSSSVISSSSSYMKLSSSSVADEVMMTIKASFMLYDAMIHHHDDVKDDDHVSLHDAVMRYDDALSSLTSYVSSMMRHGDDHLCSSSLHMISSVMMYIISWSSYIFQRYHHMIHDDKIHEKMMIIMHHYHEFMKFMMKMIDDMHHHISSSSDHHMISDDIGSMLISQLSSSSNKDDDACMMVKASYTATLQRMKIIISSKYDVFEEKCLISTSSAKK